MNKRSQGIASMLMLVTSAAFAADDGAVKIGVLNDQTSVYAVDGGLETVEAVRMAADDAGLVLGHKVEVVGADHQNKPEVGLSIARRWYDVEGVDAIADVPNSAIGFGVQTLASDRKKLALFVGALSSDITGPKCSAYSVQWSVDTWSLSHVMGTAVVKQGGTSWFFIGADYVFGKTLAKETTDVVEANGGKVLGAVYAPLNTSDFSSFILQAQNANAKVIGLANSADDTANAMKQSVEFGLGKDGQRFAAYVLFLDNIKAITLPVAKGLLLTDPFYWDLDEETRAFSKRFEQRIGHPPDWDPAMTYSVVAHYLKAVKAAGTKDADKVMAKMRELPVNDFTTKDGRLRPDGRLERSMYLLQVKTPEESKGPYDYYKLLQTVPGSVAFRPLDQGGCPLVKN